LRIWSGIKSDEAILPKESEASSFNFRAAMQPDELLALFEAAYATGGNKYKLVKAEPTTFLNGSGTRFEFFMDRKADNVKLQGLGYFAVRNNELHAIVFTAPRLAFFPRHVQSVEKIAVSATLR
jgi:hypothetical protein